MDIPAYRQLMAAERGELASPRDEPVDWLSNSKWSTLKPETHKQKWIYVVFLLLSIYMTIKRKKIINLRGWDFGGIEEEYMREEREKEKKKVI